MQATIHRHLRQLKAQKNLDKNGCNKDQNELTKEFNKQLNDVVSNLRAKLAHSAFTYVDVFSAKYSLISNAKKSGPREILKSSRYGKDQVPGIASEPISVQSQRLASNGTEDLVFLLPTGPSSVRLVGRAKEILYWHELPKGDTLANGREERYLNLGQEFELRLKQTFHIFDLEEMVIKMAHRTWNMPEVYFYAIDTNAQAVLQSAAKKPLQIGELLAHALALSAGSGGNPLLGEEATEESKEAITAFLGGSDLVFITTGIGGGTGSGFAPVVAQISREADYLSVGVVTYRSALKDVKDPSRQVPIWCYLFVGYAHCNLLRRILSAMEEKKCITPVSGCLRALRLCALRMVVHTPFLRRDIMRNPSDISKRKMLYYLETAQAVDQCWHMKDFSLPTIAEVNKLLPRSLRQQFKADGSSTWFILRHGLKAWSVEIVNHEFRNGWDMFRDAHSLKLDHEVVFECECKWVFHTIMFDADGRELEFDWTGGPRTACLPSTLMAHNTVVKFVYFNVYGPELRTLEMCTKLELEQVLLL
ncbi:hypothetical protein RHMOL_Rhmol03G0018000 [Rhododendron molle]|uniref:Uncharacterized protein n=1 Tax=Rhododendron molle TaxID=49168 RepID=A0ACC0PBY4_RHOML|nr:hypothetical protein RHMOL_Rhmol03G0018000 [Rhododendron molle]